MPVYDKAGVTLSNLATRVAADPKVQDVFIDNTCGCLRGCDADMIQPIIDAIARETAVSSWVRDGQDLSKAFPPIERDGWLAYRDQHGASARFVWNEEQQRIEIFLVDGGWFGLNKNGTWEYDCAPFAG